MVNVNKTSEALETLKEFLTALFQFDTADLDFGIYKILHYKKAEVEAFINRLLTEKVREQLNILSSAENENLYKLVNELEKNAYIGKYLEAVRKNDAQRISFYEEEFKEEIGRYQSLKSQLEHQISTNEAEPLIYNHLTLFFNRYYDNGDFISKRRYGKSDKYVVPYNGEETLFHWANADQYYIKSSELFKKYSFRIPAPSGFWLVHFKLRETQEESGNVKSENNKYFIISDPPVDMDRDEITIWFEYRALRNGEKEAKGKTQEELNAYALPLISKALEKHVAIVEMNKPVNEKTRLAVELNRYTARNKYDFFIHKDLKGFLNRELDFYIKTELLKLDDLTLFDTVTHYEKIKLQFNIIKTFKNIASTIIDFISQVEDFQKKLWEKKKFVISTHYVITLDKLAAFTSNKFTDEILEEVLTNDKQLAEWKNLFGEAILAKWDQLQPGDLKNDNGSFRKLPVDTIYFPDNFRWKLLCKISEQINIEEKFDGLVIQSDNYQAIKLIEEKYYEKIKCAYYDPPFNTGGSEFNYKNEYRHSSWCSMLKDRLDETLPLIKNDGVTIVAIDDFEIKDLIEVFEKSFGSENYLGNLVIEIKPSGRTNDYFLATSHEYCLIYAKDRSKVSINFSELSEEQKKQYKNSNGEVQYKWRDFLRTGGYSTPEERPNSFYPIFYNSATEEISLEEIPDSVKILPIDSSGKFRVWRKTPISFLNHLKEGEINITLNSSGEPKIQIIDKIKSGVRPKSVWIGARYDAATHGSKLLKSMFVESPFSYPKSVYATMDSLNMIIDDNDTVIDIFGGSGTTVHAIQLLNNKDDGERKFVLVEQNSYFYSVILPRIKKIAYTLIWNEGNPKLQNGPGIFFKYQRLEQYEDALENVAFNPEIDTTQTQLKFDDYIPKYFLHFETRDSKTFLNMDAFQDPLAYTLKVFDNYGYTEQTVDVVETFNYLAGLQVNRYKRESHGGRDYLFVAGADRQNRKVVTVWRDVNGIDYADDRDFIRSILTPRPPEGGEGDQPDGFGDYDLLFANYQCAVEGALMIEEVFKTRMVQSEGIQEL